MPFHACGGGSNNSACGGAWTTGMRGIAFRGVALGLLVVVSCWLGGWGGGIGGGSCGGSAMVDSVLCRFIMCEVWIFLVLRQKLKNTEPPQKSHFQNLEAYFGQYFWPTSRGASIANHGTKLKLCFSAFQICTVFGLTVNILLVMSFFVKRVGQKAENHCTSWFVP